MFCLDPITFFFWKKLDSNMSSKQVVFDDGKYAIPMDCDRPPRKGNQVTQEVIAGEISQRMKSPKIRATNYGNHSLKTDGRTDG